MRNAGVEIEILIEYMTLFEQGKSTVEARKKLLEEQREKLLEKQKNITETLERLNYKIELYDEIVDGKRKDFTENVRVSMMWNKLIYFSCNILNLFLTFMLSLAAFFFFLCYTIIHKWFKSFRIICFSTIQLYYLNHFFSILFVSHQL